MGAQHQSLFPSFFLSKQRKKGRCFFLLTKKDFCYKSGWNTVCIFPQGLSAAPQASSPRPDTRTTVQAGGRFDATTFLHNHVDVGFHDFNDLSHLIK